METAWKTFPAEIDIMEAELNGVDADKVKSEVQKRLDDRVTSDRVKRAVPFVI